MVHRDRKIDLLKRKEFRYHFDHEVYYSPRLRKVFSREAIEDHSVEWLRRGIREASGDWKFYFNEQPSQNIKEIIIREISK